MKKITLIFILSILTTLFIACGSSSTIKEPEAIGTYAFKILKNIENTSKEEFISKLLTIEKIQEAVKKENSGYSERSKKEILRMTKDDYNSRIEGDYTKLKKQGIVYNIDWKKINYLNYTYKTNKNDEGTDGKLYFSHNSQKYTVSVSTISVEEGYAIIELERLRKNTQK